MSRVESAGSSKSGESVPSLTKAKVEELLAARFSEGFKGLRDIPSPFDLHDMERAAERIVRAIEGKERITVVGDYDVDGVVSTAIMEEFFEFIGYPVDTVIPNRFRDGYGISPSLLDKIDADLIITVDNGITAFEAAKICRKRGIDLIITDHHTVAETLPDAYAVINPKKRECSFAYPEICGAQVAWFLVGALKIRLGVDLSMSRFLDLLALAIVADVMPLVSINRALVRRGLALLSVSDRPALEAARAYLGKRNFAAMDIGFAVAPRLNSAGRMEDASEALRFLRAKNLSEASRYWLRLEELNRLRRSTEAEATDEAMAMADPDAPVIVVAKEGWHEGIVGIVASRLVERFKKPSIVLSIEKGRAKGSGRSVGEVDLFSLLQSCEKHLSGFGGHKMAAGLTLPASALETFREEICSVAQKIDPSLFVPADGVMGELPMDEIDWELMEILERFEPYGEANDRPRFLIRGAEVLEVRHIGAQNNHLRLLVGDRGKTLQAIQFGFERDVKKGERISLTGTLQVNEFNEKRSIQMLVDKILFN